MTISVENNKNVYIGNGSTKTFSFTFKIYQDSDLTVTTETGGVSTSYLLDTDYTVSGTNVNTGGSVMFTTAPTDGHSVILLGTYNYTQGTVYVPGSNFPAVAHERALDKQMSLALKHEEILDRSLRFRDTHTDGHVKVDTPVEGQTLVWGTDSLGSVVLENFDAGYDHGGLSGLSDDDHTQYHTNTRGDVRYYTQAQVDTLSGTLIDAIAVASGTTDHGLLSGLDDNDHPQYLHTTSGTALYYTKTALDGGQLNTIYYTESEINGLLSAAQGTLTTHKTSSDHDGRYYTETEVDALIAAIEVSTEAQWGQITLASGVTSAFITISGTDDTDYYMTGSFQNDTDSPFTFYNHGFYGLTTSGCYVAFEDAMDSANYKFNWHFNRDVYVPPVPEYRSIFDNTKWETSVYETPNGTWSTDEWDASYSSGYRVRLVPIGGWEVGLRPTKMRLTWDSNYTGSENDVFLSDGYGGNVIGVDYSNESGDEITLDFDDESAGDIGELYMAAADIGDRDFQITNIELFY